MKKGISLIVLVITIIVMIIIAGAIIISLNSSNVIEQSNDAVYKSNLSNAKSTLALKYAEVLGAHYVAHPTEDYKVAADTNTANVTGKAADQTDLAYFEAAIDALTDTDDDFDVAIVDGTYAIVATGTVTPAL